MPSIGANNVVVMRGEFQTLADQIEEITRPNVDGVAVRVIGQRGVKFQIYTGVDVDDAAAAEALAATYKALQGTLVTVVDAHGQTHTYIAVHHVDIVRKRPLANAVGGLSALAGYWVDAAWTLQETNTV